MNRREEHNAQSESRDEMMTEPGRQRPHESAMARFVAGIAYEEHEHDEKDRTDDTRHRKQSE